MEYNTLEPRLDLARILDKGCIDALFLADVVGLYDNYRGGPETSIREGMQVPVNDPMLLIPAMAASATGMPALIRVPATVMVTSVPIITTSPWAKLISPIMPYTIV